MLPGDAAGVLAARARRQVADRAEADRLALAVQWAGIHPAESIEDSERFRLRSGGESPVGSAGPGAPLVAELSVAEFAAAVGLGTEQGKYYLGHAVELRYRQVSLAGTSIVTGELELADALDLAPTTNPDTDPDASTQRGAGPRGPAPRASYDVGVVRGS